MSNLLTASSFRDSDVRYRHYLETEFRETTMWCDPGAPHSWRNSNRLKLISFLTFKPTAGFREQVKELVMALKAITSYHCWFLFIKMLESVEPRSFESWIGIGFITKEDVFRMRTPASGRLFNHLHKANSKK
jgi:hypothetical protein